MISVVVVAFSQVFVCGRNNHGQCALPSSTTVIRNGPVEVPTLSGLKTMMAACGNSHTLLLTRDKRVLVFGQNNNGQLGLGDRPEQDVFEYQELVSLKGKNVYKVEAGGDQSFALCFPSTPVTTVDDDTMDLIRKFSVVKPATSFYSASALQLQVRVTFWA